jgi:hypothetical protein
MAARQRPLDVVFVIDSTLSMSKVLQSATNKAFDLIQWMRNKHPDGDFRWGAVSYRDPVDRPGEDEHYFFDLVGNDGQEDLQEFLGRINASGGGDVPEDFVGALGYVFDKISWRTDSCRTLIWFAGSNAHGFKFSGRHRHDDQIELLERCVVRLATEGYRFMGINVVEEGRQDVDSIWTGANRTFAAMKELYEANKGKSFTVQMFDSEPGPETNGLTAALTRSLQGSLVLG